MEGEREGRYAEEVEKKRGECELEVGLMMMMMVRRRRGDELEVKITQRSVG